MAADAAHGDEFYLRYYVGHKSRRFGHEFMVSESNNALHYWSGG